MKLLIVILWATIAAAAGLAIQNLKRSNESLTVADDDLYYTCNAGIALCAVSGVKIGSTFYTYDDTIPIWLEQVTTAFAFDCPSGEGVPACCSEWMYCPSNTGQAVCKNVAAAVNTAPAFLGWVGWSCTFPRV